MAFVRFQDLEVYKLAEKLADAAWEIVEKWNYLARDTVGKQLIRAADGIGANIAEGAGRGSRIDNRRFIRIARGSLNEVHHWFRRAFQRKLLTTEQSENIRELLDQLGPKLNAYLSSFNRSTGAASAATSKSNKH